MRFFIKQAAVKVRLTCECLSSLLGRFLSGAASLCAGNGRGLRLVWHGFFLRPDPYFLFGPPGGQAKAAKQAVTS